MRTRFYRAWTRDQLTAASRIRAATSVGWLAAASPWVLVFLLLARPENRSIFVTAQGIGVLAIGAVLTAISLVVSDRMSKPKVVSRADSSNALDKSLHLAGKVEILGFLLDAGLPLRLAVDRAINSGDLVGQTQLERFAELITSGMSVQEAALSARADSKDDRLNELFTKLAISDQLGMVDSAEFYEVGQGLREQWLVHQSAAALAIETRLLLPQVILSLPLTVLFALYPSVTLLSNSLL